jgi:hypothetical protein
MNNDQAGKSGLIAPKVTEGGFEVEGLWGSNGFRIAAVDGGSSLQIGAAFGRHDGTENAATAQMLAASKKLAEALNEVLRIEQGDLVNIEYKRAVTAWRKQARAALLSAGSHEA